jgi:RIO-like serine/threonine protein kinase
MKPYPTSYEKTKQAKDYMPAQHQILWCGFHEADFEKEYELLQVRENGIVVSPIDKKRKRVFFVPFTALDYFAWYPMKTEDSEGKEVGKND